MYYLRQDGDSEGLVVVFAHQVERDDWEDVPGCSASLPTYQLLPQPEPRGKLLCLKKHPVITNQGHEGRLELIQYEWGKKKIKKINPL